MNPFPHLKRATKPLFAGREGAPFSLGLRGRLLAAGGGTLRLQATKVRSYPGGLWLEIEPRTLEIGVPPESAVEERLAVVVGFQRLATAKTQMHVAVFTAKARVTHESILGAPGSLTASRVSPLR